MHVSPITVCNQFQQIERYKSAVFFSDGGAGIPIG